MFPRRFSARSTVGRIACGWACGRSTSTTGSWSTSGSIAERAEKLRLLDDTPRRRGRAPSGHRSRRCRGARRARVAPRPRTSPTGSPATVPGSPTTAPRTTWNLAHLDLHPIDVAGRLVQEDVCLLTARPRRSGRARVQRGLGVLPDASGPARQDRPRHARRARAGPPLRRAARSTGRQHPRPSPRRPAGLAPELEPARRSRHLFQPGGHNRDGATPGRDGRRTRGRSVFLRVERQTLRRFPGHGAVLFTIRVFHRPLEVLVDRDAAARGSPRRSGSYPTTSPGTRACPRWPTPRSLGSTRAQAPARSDRHCRRRGIRSVQRRAGRRSRRRRRHRARPRPRTHRRRIEPAAALLSRRSRRARRCRSGRSRRLARRRDPRSTPPPSRRRSPRRAAPKSPP